MPVLFVAGGCLVHRPEGERGLPVAARGEEHDILAAPEVCAELRQLTLAVDERLVLCQQRRPVAPPGGLVHADEQRAELAHGCVVEGGGRARQRLALDEDARGGQRIAVTRRVRLR